MPAISPTATASPVLETENYLFDQLIEKWFGTVSSQTSANLTLDFSNPKTTLAGNFDIVQRYVPTSGVTTVQLAKGKGATEILGPATGGQIAGTEVQGGKVTKLFYQQYTSGGGEKFLTPKAKFAFDEQTALAEAARKEKTIERLVREKELQEKFNEWYDRGYIQRNSEENFRERNAILQQALQYNVHLDPAKLNQIVLEQQKLNRIGSFLKPYVVKPSADPLHGFVAQMAASGRLASDVGNKEADKAWEEGQYGDSLILSTIAGVFGSAGKLVNPESTKTERSFAFVLLAIDAGTFGGGSAAKQGVIKVGEKVCVKVCGELVEVGEHALKRMIQRKISIQEVKDALLYGQKYFDKLHNNFVYLKDGIRVSVEGSNFIKTVVHEARELLPVDRFIPFK